MAKTSAAQQRAVHKYVKNNYDRLELSVPKGEKVTIQQAAKQAGQSVNAYIYEAVCARMQQENAASGTPGVVVIGRGFFAQTNSLTHAKEHKSG